MLRLTRTGIGLLTRQYRSVLKKCWLINVGLFTAGVVWASNEAVAEVSAMESTLDKIYGESLSYLSNPHQTYDLVTTKGDNTNSIIINGTTYYYTPSEGSAAAKQKLVNLANTGGGALTSSTTEPDNYIFKINNGDTTYTYYSYDTSGDGAKFAKSGIKISPTSTGASVNTITRQLKKIYVFDLEKALLKLNIADINKEFEAKIKVLNDEVSTAQKKIASLKETKDKDTFSDMYLQSLTLKRDTMLQEYTNTLESLTEEINQTVANVGIEKMLPLCLISV